MLFDLVAIFRVFLGLDFERRELGFAYQIRMDERAK